MESTTKTDLKVGIFMAIGIFLFSLSVLLLGGNNVIFKRYYDLKVRLKQVEGLAEGSIVSLAGLNVGNVSEMRFSAKDNKLVVTLHIDRSFQNRIREGSTAEVRTQGALGDKYVFINPSGDDGPVLKSGQYIKAESGGDLFSVISNKTNSIKHLFDVIDQMNKLMTAINGNNRSLHLMNNLVSASRELKESARQINLMITHVDAKNHEGQSQLRASVYHLSHILKKIDDGRGTLGALINDPTISERIKELLGPSPRHHYLKGLVRDAIETNEHDTPRH